MYNLCKQCSLHVGDYDGDVIAILVLDNDQHAVLIRGSNQGAAVLFVVDVQTDMRISHFYVLCKVFKNVPGVLH